MLRRAFILNDLNVVVNVHTRTGRNKLTDNNILFKTLQVIALALDGSVRKSSGSFLERSR